MKSLKILLVEDSPSDVRLIREVVKEAHIPIQLSLARDGVEALDYMRQTETGTTVRPDIILLDLNLPRKNGREVLAELKASVAFRQIPVLVMTSSQAEDDIRACYGLNANCYITKPINLSQYFQVVRAIENFWCSTATLPGHGGYTGMSYSQPQVASSLSH
jgi:chemotaxis family two-component system response regulator Rcp1